MAMEMNMINPNMMCHSAYEIDDYILVFSGFEGIGNIDEDGDEFYYYCCMWHDRGTADGWGFHAEKIYEDDHIDADFTKAQEDFVRRYMMDGIGSYYQLVEGEITCHTVEVMERSTGKVGVANTCKDGVQVFYGSDDGSDDVTIAPIDFSERFIITGLIGGE